MGRLRSLALGLMRLQYLLSAPFGLITTPCRALNSLYTS